MQGEDGQIFKCQRVRGRAEDRPRQESLIYPAAVHETGYWRDRVLARPHRQRRLATQDKACLPCSDCTETPRLMSEMERLPPELEMRPYSSLQ